MSITIFFIVVANAWCVFVEAIGTGDYIPISEAPYYVAIDDWWFKLIQGTNYCGGSILSESWIITAAHCAKDFEIPLRVHTGETTQQSDGIINYVDKIIIHPDFECTVYNENSKFVHNDIALLKLNSPISFDNYQQPIKISSTPIQINDNITVMGFGLEKVKTDTATLKKTQLRADELLLPTLFSTIDEYSEVCPGDSGGPAVSNNKLVGIISMGAGCRSWSKRLKMKHSLITPIYMYYDWIIKHTGLKY